jgi:crotonobetainyl-CoA:carnitine CoA-transferase CaiB-like acyl-CoA transferase
LEWTLTDSLTSKGILSGLRILELGHYVAAPFCSRLLGDLGADIIKIEPPGGDPVRKWGEQVNGHSIWWSMHGRNKRSIIIDLKTRKGRDLIADLVEQCDALIENFRPGKLEKLGLPVEALRARNPKLVVAQISGYGQSGPYRDRAAFGVIGEAVGGLRHLTNHPANVTNLPPVRVGVSIGDSIAGLYAAFGIMAALWNRERCGRGHDVDVALSEAVLSMMEGMLPEYGALGKIKEPTGGGIATAAPSNTYPTADDHWILIAANSDPLFAKLATLMKAPGLAVQKEYRDNQARVRHSAELDSIIAAWTRKFTIGPLLALLSAANIPSTKVYTAKDCAIDPQYRSRGMIREVDDPLVGRLLHAGIVPHFPSSPGNVRWTGPAPGHHTDQILRDIARLSAGEIEALRNEGVVQ